MRLLYIAAAVLLVAESAILWWAASPDVDPVYRAVYIDRTSDCYPVEVSGKYALGRTISFAQTGDSSGRGDVVRCGWRDAARTGSWSDGEMSMFRFRIDPAPTDFALDLVIWPYIMEDLVTSQQVRIASNGETVATLELNRETLPYRRIVIPRPLAQPVGGFVEVTFHYPDALSPRELGLGNDRYRYAVHLHSLSLSRIYPPPR